MIRRPYFGEYSIVSKIAYNRTLKDLAPDIVLMNHSKSMSLVPAHARATVIADTHLLSVERHLSIRAQALLAEEKYEFSCLEFEIKDFMGNSTDEVSEEAAALNKADLILAISKEEEQIFQDQAECPVQLLNYRAEAPEAIPQTCRSQVGIMPIGTGDNPHNILGAYCIDRAMRCSNAGRTLVATVGRASYGLRLGSWCEPVGHVANYFEAVGSYGFGVCPAFWGAGAQVKQYEFAELGMPIVAYRWMVDSELWVDGEDCLLVDNPGDFAERLCSIASSKLMSELSEGAKLLKLRAAERLVRQYAELDRRIGLSCAA
jgi:hypothetical protein